MLKSFELLLDVNINPRLDPEHYGKGLAWLNTDFGTGRRFPVLLLPNIEASMHVLMSGLPQRRRQFIDR